MQHNSAFEALCEMARQHVQEITVTEVRQKMLQKTLPLLVDVREEAEWEKGRLSHALHLSRGILERDIEAIIPDKSTPLILYCAGGYRSVLAAESLQKMGYTAVSSMAGGYRRWLVENYPIDI